MLTGLDARTVKWSRRDGEYWAVTTKFPDRRESKVEQVRHVHVGTQTSPNYETKMATPEAKAKIVDASNDLSKKQADGLQFSLYTNCIYTRGRGCHVGSGTRSLGRSFRYTTCPLQRGYVRLGRTGTYWSDYYDHYDDRYLYEDYIIAPKEKTRVYCTYFST